MVQQYRVKGYEEFCDFMEKFKESDLVHVYFSGYDSGDLWCDDCERAWPVIEKNLTKLDKSSHFVYVEVGSKPYWKDLKCPFRTDPRLKLLVLPTLIRWKKPQKLSGDECEKEDLVEMLFTDED